MLLFNGHGSHFTSEFISYYYQHQIVTMALPPHTTHLMQPLGVGYFQPLKHYHSKSVEGSIRTGEYSFDRAEFFSFIGGVRRKAFVPNTIKSAWPKCGLRPPYLNRHRPSEVPPGAAKTINTGICFVLLPSADTDRR